MIDTVDSTEENQYTNTISHFYNSLPTKMRERITSMATVPWWELEEVWPSVLPRVPFLALKI